MTEWLTDLAGGDQFEQAVAEVRRDVEAARRRLEAEFPQFSNPERETTKP